MTAAAVAATAMAATPAGAEARTFGDRVLKQGKRGPDVRVLQDHLTRVGVRTGVDGHFGPATRTSVRRWERAIEIKVDGKVSKRNAKRLKRMVSRGRTIAGTTQAPKGEQTAPPATVKARIGRDGKAIAPESAPQAIKDMIAAANEIHDKPYRYGGGHGKLNDSGYDCSGSLSYVFRKTGHLKQSMDSTGFMSWRKPGKGQWVTTYAHGGHAYMVIAGLRFDTSGRQQRRSRWTTEMRSAKGFTARHIGGL